MSLGIIIREEERGTNLQNYLYKYASGVAGSFQRVSNSVYIYSYKNCIVIITEGDIRRREYDPNIIHLDVYNEDDKIQTAVFNELKDIAKK